MVQLLKILYRLTMIVSAVCHNLGHQAASQDCQDLGDEINMLLSAALEEERSHV